jgi:hypothetical protein
MRARAIRRCGGASRCFAALVDAAAKVMNLFLPRQGPTCGTATTHVILRKRLIRIERDVVRDKAQGSAHPAGDAICASTLSAAQQYADGQLYCRRPAEERG